MDKEKTEQEIESEIREIEKQIEIEHHQHLERLDRLEMQKLKLINLIPEDEFEDLED